MIMFAITLLFYPLTDSEASVIVKLRIARKEVRRDQIKITL